LLAQILFGDVRTAFFFGSTTNTETTSDVYGEDRTNRQWFDVF
jgi:hypothetical protein